MKTIVALDPAILNLGLVSVVVDDNHAIMQVPIATRVDLTTLAAKGSHVVDRVLAFKDKWGHVLDGADIILAERQPPGGGGECVGALLYCLYRDKTILISPAKLHKHFALPAKDYEGRKIKVVQLASKYLDGNCGFETQERKHDICDALSQVMYWCEQERKAKYNVFARFSFLGGTYGSS